MPTRTTDQDSDPGPHTDKDSDCRTCQRLTYNGSPSTRRQPAMQP